MIRLGIIGGGRAAWTFARIWTRSNRPLSGIGLRPSSTSPLPALLGVERLDPAELARRSDVICFAVPDDAIAPLYEELAGTISPDAMVFHASGALSSGVFTSHERRFSLHPLQALPRPGVTPVLEGAVMVFEGHADGRGLAAFIAEAAGARLVEIAPDRKILYHAAAVFASNFVAVLLESSRSLFGRAGLTGELDEALAGLARSAVENWASNRGADRFTGPVARGDRAIVERHLAALAADPALHDLYLQLARILVPLVVRDRPDDPEILAMQRFLRP